MQKIINSNRPNKITSFSETPKSSIELEPQGNLEYLLSIKSNPIIKTTINSPKKSVGTTLPNHTKFTIIQDEPLTFI